MLEANLSDIEGDERVVVTGEDPKDFKWVGG